MHNKLITISATLLMGTAALGGVQSVTQAMRNHHGPITSMVNSMVKKTLGTEVYADEAIEVRDNAIVFLSEFDVDIAKEFYVSPDGRLAIACNARRIHFSDVFDELTVTNGKTGITKTIDLNTSASPDSLYAGDSFSFTTNAQTSFNMHGDEAFYEGPNTLKSSTKYYGLVKPDGSIKISLVPHEQQGQTTVTFDHTAPAPGEPDWYGIVPASIVFNDQNKEQPVDAKVKIVNATDQKSAYSGDKVVDVKVASTNGFELKDGEKVPVEYSLTKKDGTAVSKGTDEQVLGTLRDGDTVIPSVATIKGKATISGHFVDTLNYDFSERG